MATLESLVRKMKSVDDLQSIVRTMKAMAAANLHQYERSVESLQDYHHTVALGLQIVLRGNGAKMAPKIPLPRRKGALLAVVIGTDYGFAGQFNEEIIRYALQVLNHDHSGNCQVIAVGGQIAAGLTPLQRIITASFSLPASLAGINPLVQRLLLEIERLKADQDIEEVLLLFNRPAAATTYTQEKVRLFPVSMEDLHSKTGKWPSRSMPISAISHEQMLSALVREYIYVNIFRSIALSMAGENASRLAAMHAAVKKIEEVSDALTMKYRQNRQNAITGELLDIISGFEALAQ
jgi:F-type H+-transporting ATPase subunit gamma